MPSTAETVIEAFVMIIICLLAILGNASLFIIVFSNRSLRTVSNYYVLSLAAADLMVTLVSGPVTIFTMIRHKWVFGERACTGFGFITLLTFIASVANLAMIALNRYFYIVRWKSYKQLFTTSRGLIYGACVWVISFFLSLPTLVGWSRIKFIPEKSYCFVHWASDVYYMYFMVIICFCGPLTVLMISYYKILRFTKSLKKRLFVKTLNKKDAKREARLVSPEEIKLTHTLLLVVACFVICWAPFAITMFFDVHYPNFIPRSIHVLSLCLGYLNSMCNPIVYGVRNSNFKKGFNNLYACCFPCIFKKEDFKISRSITNSDVEQRHVTLSKLGNNVAYGSGLRQAYGASHLKGTASLEVSRIYPFTIEKEDAGLTDERSCNLTSQTTHF